MGLHVEEPFCLLLIIPAGLYLFYAWRRTPRLTGARKAAAFAFRAIIMLLLIAIAAGAASARSRDCGRCGAPSVRSTTGCCAGVASRPLRAEAGGTVRVRT